MIPKQHNLQLLLLLHSFITLFLHVLPARFYSSHTPAPLLFLSFVLAQLEPVLHHHHHQVLTVMPPHLHLSSHPPSCPPTLFNIYLTPSFTHAPSHLTCLNAHSLSSSPPLFLSLSLSLPPPPPSLPRFPREDWLANLAVYPQCLEVPRRRGQRRQHEDTAKRQLRYLKMELSGQMSKRWENGEMEDRLSFLLI